MTGKVLLVKSQYSLGSTTVLHIEVLQSFLGGLDK